MYMQTNKEQAKLYKHRNDIKQSFSYSEIGNDRFKYLSKFFKKNKSLTFWVLGFLFLQTAVEIILLILINNSIGGNFINSKISIALTIIIFCILYTIIAFLSVRYERTLVLNLINDLRKNIFSSNLEMETVNNNHEKRSDFIAKISYHLSLLAMGIDNTLISSVRWLIYILVLFTFSFINKGLQISAVWFVFISSFILFYIAYLVSKKYISRQVASYSKIIRHLTDVMLEIPLIKNFRREKIVEKKLDKIVGVDTYFRIIRDTLIRYSNRVVFILIITLGSLYVLITSYYPAFTIEKSSQIFIKGIFYVYIIRILYSSVKAGLYFIPLKLGIFLCVPEKTNKLLEIRKNWSWNKINFKSNKIKLFREGDYFKKISLEFNLGNRYLFTGEHQAGKTHLAAILSGHGYFSRHSWIVKVDSEHIGYNTWCEVFKDTYFFLPNFSTDLTIGEIIFNKESEEIKESDIVITNELSLKYPIFLPIFSQTRSTGESARIFESSPVSLFAIQTIYCILNKPKIIVIDNMWIDLCYDQIEKMLQILDKELPESIIIVLGRNKNLIIPYKETYEICQNSIKKI